MLTTLHDSHEIASNLEIEFIHGAHIISESGNFDQVYGYLIFGNSLDGKSFCFATMMIYL